MLQKASELSEKTTGKPLHKGTWLVYTQLCLGMILFGLGTPVSKIVTDAFPPFAAGGLRMVGAVVVLAPFVVRHRDQARHLQRRHTTRLTALAVGGMFLFTILLLYGMKLVSGVIGSALTSTTPAITAIASFLFLNEVLGWRRMTAIVLTFVGVFIVQVSSAGSSDSQSILLGTGLVFGAVVCQASATLLVEQVADLNPLLVAGIAVGIGLVLFLPLAAVQLPDTDLSDISTAEWLALGGWGLLTLGLGTMFWYTGVEKVKGSTAAGFMGIMPISSVVFSYLLLGERFHWLHVAGFGIVLGAVGLIAWAHSIEDQEEEPNAS